ADIFDTADGLVAIEQAEDAALHHAARRAEGDQRAIDDVEPEGVDVEVGDVADLADAIDLGGPSLDVVDADQPGIEVGQHALARAAGIDVAERLLAELAAIADAEPPVGVLERREDLATRLADDMAVGQRIDGVAVGHQTADRGDVRLALHHRLHAIAAADQI